MGRVEYTTVGNAVVGSLLYKGNLVEFLIDLSDAAVVKQHAWHYTPNGYLATTMLYPNEAKRREIYLHNFLMKPKAGEIVEHITKEGLDNRRANLRVTDEAEAAGSKKTKERHVELPPLSGLVPEDIPKHIWYVQPNGYHRDRFAIELKREGILWKTTSSKKVSLAEKLAQAKEKLKEVYAAYPYLDPAREKELVDSLISSYRTTLDSLRH
jgi:hypothetical protein